MAAGISGYFFFQLKGLLQLLADLNPIELLWHDLKRAIHTRHPKNTAELELFCKEELRKHSFDRSGDLIPNYWSAWRLLLPNMCQVIKPPYSSI